MFNPRIRARKFLQSLEPLRHRNEFRIGNGISGAREQIGEADLRAERAGQHPQRQIKRTGGLFQQVIEAGLGHDDSTQLALYTFGETGDIYHRAFVNTAQEQFLFITGFNLKINELSSHTNDPCGGRYLGALWGRGEMAKFQFHAHAAFLAGEKRRDGLPRGAL